MRELRYIFGVAQESQVPTCRLLQRGQAFNQQIGITHQTRIKLGCQCINDGSEFYSHAAPAPWRGFVLLRRLSAGSGIQRLEHFVGDVVLGVDVDRFLKN